MAETLVTTLSESLNAVLTNPNSTYGDAVFTLSKPGLIGGSLTSGTGADKANQLYVQQVTLAASANTSINLHAFGGATDQLGQALSIVTLKYLLIQILGNLGCFKVTALAINTAGTGYTVNDVVTGSTGTGTKFTGTVASVTGGAITAIMLTTAGSYSVAPSATDAVTGGTGTGAILTVTNSAITTSTPPVFVESDFLTIGNVGTTAGWTSFLTPNSASVLLYSGTINLPGTFKIGEGGGTGWVVGASSTNNILKIVNSGSNPVTFLIVVVGATA